MGESELKIALKREGEARILNLWKEAEVIVDKRRKEVERAIELLRENANREIQTELAVLRKSMLFETQAKAMTSRLHAEAEAQLRLSRLAEKILPELAGQSRIELWQATCKELPTSEWASISVHPEDLQRAKRDFPLAVIDCDENLFGGLIANNAEGTVCIDNTLHCRLMRIWPDLLPKLFDDLRKRIDDEACHSEKTV